MGYMKQAMARSKKDRERRQKQRAKAQKRTSKAQTPKPRRKTQGKPKKQKRGALAQAKHTWKRTMLIGGALLFCGFLYAAYDTTHGVFSSRSGRVLTWSTGTALSPVADSLPWWFWCGLIGLAIYLWVKHKLVMSIVYGILAGIYLAL